MITTTDKSAFSAFVDTNGERRLLPVAAIAANLTRVSWVHSFKRPASVFSFAFRYREKASPGHVADRLRKMMVIHHPSNVQILNRDRVKTVDKIGRNLMMKIPPAARYFQVRFGDFDSLFDAALRSLFLARKPSLFSLQIIQRILEIARILDLFAGRECGETGNADIHTNCLPGRRQWLRFRYLANNQRIPAVNAACDPNLFALSFDRAGEPDATGPHTRNRKFVAFDRARPDLLVFLREGVIALFALESGKARLISALDTSKEAFKSFVKTFERVLLDRPQMALYFRQCSSIGQMARLFSVTKSSAGNLIARNPLGQRGVIDLAGMFKFTLASFYKAFVSTKLELEGLNCSILGIGHRVTFPINVARWRDLVRGWRQLSGRFAYITLGQSMQQQNSEWNALRTRDTVLRSPVSIPLRFTAEGGGSFRVAAATASLQGGRIEITRAVARFNPIAGLGL